MCVCACACVCVWRWRWGRVMLVRHLWCLEHWFFLFDCLLYTPWAQFEKGRSKTSLLLFLLLLYANELSERCAFTLVFRSSVPRSRVSPDVILSARLQGSKHQRTMDLTGSCVLNKLIPYKVRHDVNNQLKTKSKDKVTRSAAFLCCSPRWFRRQFHSIVKSMPGRHNDDKWVDTVCLWSNTMQLFHVLYE